MKSAESWGRKAKLGVRLSNKYGRMLQCEAVKRRGAHSRIGMAFFREASRDARTDATRKQFLWRNRGKH
jgi:hypothetical protein